MRFWAFLAWCLGGMIPGAAGLELVVSHTRYLNMESEAPQPYLALYWEMNPRTVSWTSSEQGLQGRFSVSISAREEGKEALIRTYLLETPFYADIEEALTRSLLEIQRFPITDGVAEIQLEVVDLGGAGDTIRHLQPVPTDPRKDQPLLLSGITLLDTFYHGPPTQTISRFQRDEYVQIPLCFAFVPDHRHRLSYFMEAYLMPQTLRPLGEDTIEVHVVLSKTEEGPALVSAHQTYKVFPQPRMPIRGSMDLSQLPSGNYYLHAWVQDAEGEIWDRSSVFFQRSHKQFTPENRTLERDTSTQKVAILDLSATFLKPYDLSQLKAILKMLEPISTPVERSAIQNFGKRPEEIYIRYFIYNFWKTRDPNDPGKAWAAYADRVREVNRLFGNSQLTRGYETDRGYVYLKFGPPKERIPVLNESGSLPYEIWVYDGTPGENRQGVFLFYQPGHMINDFALLHSSVRGEMRNMAWRSFLYRTGEANPFSRAEQYPFP